MTCSQHRATIRPLGEGFGRKALDRIPFHASGLVAMNAILSSMATRGARTAERLAPIFYGYFYISARAETV